MIKEKRARASFALALVVAHQLTLATPRRSREERAVARIERRAARKVHRIRTAAVRTAVAEIDADGTAHLVYAPGRYTLARFGRLDRAIVPALPVDPGATDWDAELADLLAAGTPERETGRPSTEPGSTDAGTSPVATLDPGADLHESRPDRPTIDRRPGRSMAQLRSELRQAIEAGTVDPGSAESIRKTLRCSAARARQLRNDHATRNRKGGSQQ